MACKLKLFKFYVIHNNKKNWLLANQSVENDNKLITYLDTHTVCWLEVCQED